MFKISGKVIKGKGYGRKLGYPTVNLDPVARERQGGNHIKSGVYAGSATLNNQTYLAAIVIDHHGGVEAHLLGYNGDAYGQIVTLEFGKYLREFRNFRSEEELIAQIEDDIENV